MNFKFSNLKLIPALSIWNKIKNRLSVSIIIPLLIVIFIILFINGIKLAIAGISISIMLIIMILGFLYKVLGSIDQKLRDYDNQLENEIIKKTANLTEANKTIEYQFMLQNTLKSILQTATEDISLSVLLYKILSKLITLPFLSIEKKGSISLIEKKIETLEMKVQIGLSTEIQEQCKSVKFGHCLCGKSAQTRQLIFSDCIDSRHDTTFDGMTNHGHYVIPILSGENLLGVLNLYIESGSERKQHEEEFLISVANMLAGIIERKKIDEQLKINTKQLEKSNEELKTFSYLLSQYLRVPVDNLDGFGSKIQTNLDEISHVFEKIIKNVEFTKEDQELLNPIIYQDIPRSINFIKSTSTRISHMLNTLLDLSRIGRIVLNKELLNMNEIVQFTLGLFDYQIEYLGIKIIVNQLHEAFADSNSMEQILGQIIDNAIKYHEPKRPLIIEISSELYEFEVIYHIKDNGIGIEEKIESIFQMFVRVGEHKAPGDGMGLAFVSALVEHNGGKIWCTSKKGVGTTFSFSIPLYQSH
jgi:signal transduction histidine kinase